jgi:nitrite reductase/ring-hydroxylating ferredoxin subunit
LAGLAERLVRLGVRIHVDSPVIVVRGGEQAVVQTDLDMSVTADSLIVATNTPVNNLFAIHTKQAPYRTYVVGYAIPKGKVEGLFWDTESPQHYVRVAHENEIHDVLLVGGEDHKTGQNPSAKECFVRLEDWTERRFPVMGPPLWRWSGQVMESMDGLGFLGHNPADEENVYVISGDSGNGMTHAVIGAMIIRDQIAGRENPWAALYSPDRFNLRAAGTFFSENANVARQYMDWFHRESPDMIRNLPTGEGMVINQGLRKIAVYRTEEGGLEFHSAVCTHLAGVVRWNSVEKSWDCPCHGSRFDRHGRVLEGPASAPLKPIALDSPEAEERPGP